MRKLVMLGAGLALLAGCGGGEGGGEGGAAGQIWPLAIGNWWVYQGVQDTSQKDSIAIVSDTVYKGHDAFVAITQSDTTDTAIVYYADGYLWMVKEVQLDTLVDTLEMAWLKEQLEVGDEWTVFEKTDTVDYGGYPAEWHMLINAKVEGKEDKSVPAGDFPGCYVVRYDYTTEVLINGQPVYQNKDASKMWIYYGVGSVYGSDSSSTGTWDDSQLIDYELK